jgi:hypothetical protein
MSTSCSHPLSVIERRSEPDWKNDGKVIWYRGFCTDCGATVEVEYEFKQTVEQ